MKIRHYEEEGFRVFERKLDVANGEQVPYQPSLLTQLHLLHKGVAIANQKRRVRDKIGDMARRKIKVDKAEP